MNVSPKTTLVRVSATIEVRTLNAIANRDAWPFRPVSLRTPLPAPNRDTTSPNN